MQEPASKAVNVFQVLRRVAAAAASLNDSCASSISLMMDAALARERWALMMVDASAKLPEPLLGGLSLHLGDYDQCLRARSEAFAGRYCLVDTMDQRIATCVPSTCTWSSLDSLLANSTDGAMHVASNTCQAADDPFVFHPATAALILVLVLAVLNALGWFLLTFEGVRQRLPVALQPSPQLATAMSPVTAWRKICGTRDHQPPKAGTEGGTAATEPGSAEAGGAGEAGGPQAMEGSQSRDPEDWSWALTRMSADKGLRTLSLIWVVLGHRAALMPLLPVMDKRLLPERMKTWAHVYVPAGLFAVDSFLFLAGCVLAFHMACDRRRFPRTWRKVLPWLPTFYLHRYIRLTPLMAFVVLFYAGGLLYSGQGPLWNQRSAFDVNSCRTNWWPNLLYIHNYYNNRNMCVGHSWYLAVDMQLCLISPFLVFPVIDNWKKGKCNYGRWVFAVFLILSIVIPFAIVAIYDITPAPNPVGDQVKFLEHSELVYIPAHARAAPWVVGVGVGAWAARVVGGRRALGRWAERGLWACAVGVLVGLPLGLTGALRGAAGDHPSRWGAALFVALSKPLWALGLGAVVMLCAAGRAPRLNALLSWEPLAVLSRLAYAVYLLHPTVQGVTGWSTRGTTVATDVATIPLIVSDLALSFALAVPVSILIESPFIALERILLRGNKAHRRGSTPPQPVPQGPINDSENPEQPQPQEQGQEGDTASTLCLNVFGWCRDWLQSFRPNRRARGRTNPPTEQSRRYSTLAAQEEGGSDRTLPGGQSRDVHTLSGVVEPSSSLDSALSVASQSVSSRPNPLTTGASSEDLQREDAV